ncbi:MAG: Flp pilus assembly complex ATPase component TadA [Armatimonadetes bacterium]|nr:Flp pilus assembly complex ATPase component TadA [Armatimonadota bacterium]
MSLETSQTDKTSKETELEELARRMKVRCVNLSAISIDKEIARIIPVEMARRNHLICIGKLEKKITLAMADPRDVFATDDVKLRTGYEIEAVLAKWEDIEKAINGTYDEDESWKDKLTEDVSTKVDIIKEVEEGDEEVVIDQPVIIAVNKIIAQAVERKASDIHIEPFEKELLVRYRIDGILHEVMTFPKVVAPALISRIKILSKLDITEKRIPQDGRIHMKIKDKDLDFRISTLPTLNGESVVMRILDRQSLKVDLGALGLHPIILEDFRDLISHPHGIILVTGPTGSGKSTTLYSALNSINTPESKIVTIEDPIEYNLKGIIQVQTHAKVGLTFATGLRAFLRQDPDVMMVGEIRDKETATIATESALTGHLVLSTLHTNDAVGAVTRLIDMGVEPFLIASTLMGVLAQRLVRTICSNCAEEVRIYPEILKIFEENNIEIKDLKMLKGKGCVNCNKTGYKGRMGIHELLKMTDPFREMIIKNLPSSMLMEQAKKDGLRSLFEDGLHKVVSGKTTYEEIIRVTRE